MKPWQAHSLESNYEPRKIPPLIPLSWLPFRNNVTKTDIGCSIFKRWVLTRGTSLCWLASSWESTCHVFTTHCSLDCSWYFLGINSLYGIVHDYTWRSLFLIFTCALLQVQYWLFHYQLFAYLTINVLDFV